MALRETRRHVDLLSQAKSLPASFCEDRRSVYWENGLATKDFSKTTEFILTPRLEQLSQPKEANEGYVGDRPTPIWKISSAALTASCSSHLQELATPKTLHSSYQFPRPVCTPISTRALSANPSRRLSQLARPKPDRPLLIKPNSEWDWSQWNSDITQAALNAQPSSHLEELSSPKTLPKTYRPCRSVQWPVSKYSLQYIASDRIAKLAQFKQVPGYQKDYNPRAWAVSKAALLAQPSPCIENLAKPLPRKCRQKKS